MEKIAIFGGSFDPVHKAHIHIAELAQKSFDFKKIIFVIAYNAPHKHNIFAEIDDRVNMLKIAVRNLKNVEISLYEAKQKKVVYSYQTLDHFQNMYPKDEIVMIIGSDSFTQLPTWKNISYITQKYNFIVAKRPNISFDENTKYFKNCTFIKQLIEEISSTQVRQLIKENDETTLKELLDEKVLQYIKEKGLYK